MASLPPIHQGKWGKKALQNVIDKLQGEISFPAQSTVTVTYVKGINPYFFSSLKTGG